MGATAPTSRVPRSHGFTVYLCVCSRVRPRRGPSLADHEWSVHRRHGINSYPLTRLKYIFITWLTVVIFLIIHDSCYFLISHDMNTSYQPWRIRRMDLALCQNGGEILPVDDHHGEHGDQPSDEILREENNWSNITNYQYRISYVIMDQFMLKLTQHWTELNWLRHDIETL